MVDLSIATLVYQRVSLKVRHRLLGLKKSPIFFVTVDHQKSFRNIQSGAPKIAKLVYNSNNYGLWYL